MQLDLMSFHPGRQHNFEQAVELSKYFSSFKHLTSIYFDPKIVNMFEPNLPKIASIFKKRSSSLHKVLVDTHPMPEYRMLFKRNFSKKGIGAPDYYKRNASFQHWMIRKYKPPKICIGFDAASWIVFSEWKNKSFLVLDLSTINLIYKYELIRKHKINDVIAKQILKDDNILYEAYKEELQLADLILCPSEFSRKSCTDLGIEAEKIVVLPYGVDLLKFQNNTPEGRIVKCKVAFVGRVSPMKGADVLFSAWQDVNKVVSNVELHLYGEVQMPINQPVNNIIVHNYIPQEKLIQELKTCHISVLPTLFEGSSLAIFQSMSLGLAVITTQNAGSIIEHNKNGLIINYGNKQELVDSLLLLINNISLRTQLASCAKYDIQNYTWPIYGLRLSEILKSRYQNPNLIS